MVTSVYVPSSKDSTLVTMHDSCIRNLIAYNSNTVRFVDDPDSAEIIVVFEEWSTKFLDYVRVLSQCPLVSDFPEKVFVVNWDDLGRGFLPGCYTSLNEANYDRLFHHPCAYPYEINEFASQYVETAATTTPTKLFSFRGTGVSHPVRRRIVRDLSSLKEGTVTAVNVEFHQHTDEQKRQYVEEMATSHFVLCPRGWSPTTYRLFEAMELGRCPVIISDAWVPIPDVPWEEFSIRVPERDVPRIPRMLAERAERAYGMGQRARRVWEEHFSAPAKFRGYMDAILRLEGRMEESPLDYRERWLTRRFRYQNQWTLLQRLRTKLESVDSCRRFRR